MRTIYLVTHPEATHHLDGLVGGWYDSELTTQGQRHASLIAEELRRRIPARADVGLISSDLQRTLATATAIGAQTGAKIVVDSRWREMSYGEAEGKPTGSDARYTPLPPEGQRMTHDGGVPGAESRGTFAERVYAAMAEVIGRGNEQQIIVTHGGVVTFAIAHWISMPFDSLDRVEFRVAPGSITVLREDDLLHRRQVLSLGETNHLLL